ncbi:thermonuclease family protein [Rhodoligotrophos defluvii]|uniref:thermonuclease family protein n=1 Tax=Rhodoligotrophos defluvii TaxID=2561934 RepID=UPI0010C9C304|nr:thermonuclease family protein [Rhodoligotrophos defluvii]
MRSSIIAFIFGILVVCPARAEVTVGRVVAVMDGDTVIVLAPGNVQERVRFSAIDAPERSQPWGARSRLALSAMLRGKRVEVEWYKRDQWGRLVGRVLLDGRDVGLAQVNTGMAWWFRHFAREQTAEERRTYAAAEDAARNRRVGLWRDPAPVPPWEWRHPH